MRGELQAPVPALCSAPLGTVGQRFGFACVDEVGKEEMAICGQARHCALPEGAC